MVECPQCGGDDLELVRRLAGTARIVRCQSCGHEWQRGEVPVSSQPGRTTEQRLRARFPTAREITDDRLTTLDRLASRFHNEMPAEDREFRDHYRELFRQERLSDLTAEEFQRFYRSPRIAGLGFGGWAPDFYFRNMDTEEYMRGVRSGIEYLLYAPNGSLESRLTDLILNRGRVGVPGIKETVLTKVLAVVMPNEIFPFATYDSPGGGKRQIARKVLGLDLPAADSTDWTIGRLIIWSSDLFAEIGRRWWQELRVAAEFLWSLWKLDDEELERRLTDSP